MTYKKFWWNKVASRTACSFSKKWPDLIAFFKSKKRLPIFLSNIKISSRTFLFYKKNFRKKVFFSENSKVRYFLLGGCTNIIFDLFLDI